MTSLFILQSYNENVASDIARAWVERGEMPALASLYLSSDSFLSRGGPDLFPRASLGVEYSIVRHIVDGSRRVLGYATFGIHQYHPFQSRELYLFDGAIDSSQRLLVCQPNPSESRIHEQIIGRELEIMRSATICKSLPYRCPLILTSPLSLLLSTEANAAIRFLAVNNIHQLDSPAVSECLKIWPGSNLTNRFDAIAKIYSASHYITFGYPMYFNNLMHGWPFEALDLPSDAEVSDNDAIKGIAFGNFLQNLSFRAKISTMNSSQRALFEQTLIPLRSSGDLANDLDHEIPWQGISATGKTAWSLGRLKGIRPHIYIVNVQGGTRIGEAVYKDRKFRHPAGSVVACLWKSVNHTGYIKPEEQKGICLVADL